MDKIGHITDTFPYILGNCLFRKNQELHNLMNIEEGIEDEEFVKELFPIFENLLLRREVFDMRALEHFKEELEIEKSEDNKEEKELGTDSKLPIKMKLITHSEEYLKKNKKAAEIQQVSDGNLNEKLIHEKGSVESEENLEEKKETDDQDQDKKNPHSDCKVEKRKISEDGTLDDYSFLLRVLLNVSKHDKKELKKLVHVVTPLYNKIKYAKEILKITEIVIKDESKASDLHSSYYADLAENLPTLIKMQIEIATNKEIATSEENEKESLAMAHKRMSARKFSLLKLRSKRSTSSIKRMETINAVSQIVYYFCSHVRRDGSIDLTKNVEDFHSMINAINDATEDMDTDFKIDAAFQENILLFIVGICKEDFELLINASKNFGMFEHEKIKEIVQIFKNFQMILYGKQIYEVPELSKDIKRIYTSAKDTLMDKNLSKGGRVKKLMSQGVEGLQEGVKELAISTENRLANIGDFALSITGNQLTEIVYKDLFSLFDRDSSGVLSYGEFKDLCRYMGLHLDQERCLKLFALSDKNGNNYIDEEEFGKAVMLIKLEIAKESLRKMGLTTQDLIFFGITSIVYLILALIFIFLGIFAFSRADGFNAVINSLFPIAAGLGAASRNISVQDKAKEVKERLDEIFGKKNEEEKEQK